MRIFREWVLAIALYVALVLDGSLAFYLHQFQNWHGYGASCWLMPIGIMLIALFDDMNDKEIWCLYSIFPVSMLVLPKNC